MQVMPATGSNKYFTHLPTVYTRKKPLNKASFSCYLEFVSKTVLLVTVTFGGPIVSPLTSLLPLAYPPFYPLKQLWISPLVLLSVLFLQLVCSWLQLCSYQLSPYLLFC